MTTVQNFFARYKKQLVIMMTILVVLSFAGKFASLSWLYAGGMIVTAAAGGLPLLIKAIGALRYKLISIEFLISIAVIGALLIGEYSETGLVVWLFSLGDLLEELTLAKTRQSVKDLLSLEPQTALLVDSPHGRDYREVETDGIEKGSYILVKTGGRIPVDGLVVDGQGYADESAITGESLPSHKTLENPAFAGTLLVSGTIVIQASQVGEDTTYGKLIELIEEAEDSKTRAQRFIDKFSQYYTPLVILIALLVGLISRDVRLAITILVLGCPGALVIGVPVSTVAGIGTAARAGIMIKGSDVFSRLAKADSLVFDKTGTITEGHPAVVNRQDLSGSPDRNLRLLASVEHESDHPLAKAIGDYYQKTRSAGAEEWTTDFFPVTNSQVIGGRGLEAQVDHHILLIGNRRLMEERGIDLSALALSHTRSQILMAEDGVLTLALEVMDPVRKDVPQALTNLKKEKGLKTILLSGDSQENVLAALAGLPLDQAQGGLLPQDKEAYVRKLQAEGHTVVFMGDGINDGPALTRADVGIAVGSGTETAMKISDIVLVKPRFTQLEQAFTYARKTIGNMRENIAIAILTVILLFLGLFTGYIHMASGMLVHEVSILVVILNAMRLIRR